MLLSVSPSLIATLYHSLSLFLLLFATLSLSATIVSAPPTDVWWKFLAFLPCRCALPWSGLAWCGMVWCGVSWHGAAGRPKVCPAGTMAQGRERVNQLHCGLCAQPSKAQPSLSALRVCPLRGASLPSHCSTGGISMTLQNTVCLTPTAQFPTWVILCMCLYVCVMCLCSGGEQ